MWYLCGAGHCPPHIVHDIRASLWNCGHFYSEDEGEPDDEDNEDENEVCENSDEDDGDDEVNKCNDYNDGVIVGGTGLIGEDSPERLQSPVS